MAPPAHLAPLFQPLRIKGLEICNRFLSTSHAPGYAVRGTITDRYVAYEAEKAKGGVGLVQFGGATAVSVENSFHYGQINGATDKVVPDYRRMAAAIHAHGAYCTVQLTHGGRRERWDDANWLPPLRRPACASLSTGRSRRRWKTRTSTASARTMWQRCGARATADLDGVEISTQAGTLIEQFWSPAMNRRPTAMADRSANRMRFGLEILGQPARSVGDDFLIGIRMPGDEMLKGGLSASDCVEIARAHAASGLIDFISVVGGTAVDYQASAQIWPTMWLPSAPYLQARGRHQVRPPRSRSCMPRGLRTPPPRSTR